MGTIWDQVYMAVSFRAPWWVQTRSVRNWPIPTAVNQINYRMPQITKKQMILIN